MCSEIKKFEYQGHGKSLRPINEIDTMFHGRKIVAIDRLGKPDFAAPSDWNSPQARYVRVIKIFSVSRFECCKTAVLRDLGLATTLRRHFANLITPGSI